MKSGRVIVTYGRSLMSLVIARSLHQRGVEIIGCDDVDLTVMKFSKHVAETFTHPNIEDDEEGYFSTLLDNVKRLKPEDDRPYLLMPVFRNTKAIARRRDMFAPHITVAAPYADDIEKIFPKENLVETASRAGVRIPKTVHTNNSDDLNEKLSDFETPLLIKPVAGVGGRGISSHDTIDAAIKAHAAFVEKEGSAPLVQEKSEGEDYCFTGLFKNGDLIAHMAYRNVKSFPVKTGAGAVRETVDDAPFLESVKRLMSETNWTGVAEIDFLWTSAPADEPTLIEVNPRFWAGLFHSVKTGVDFPWLLYQLFTPGKVGDVGSAAVGETTKAPGLWLASTAQEIAESSTHFDRLKEVWADQSRSISERMKDMTRVLGETVDLNDACFRLLESYDMAKQSSDELSDDEDPFTGLGVLFVLSSLARHGRLPDEVKF